MSPKSPSQLKILNDTLDLMTLMTHVFSVANATLATISVKNGFVSHIK